MSTQSGTASLAAPLPFSKRRLARANLRHAFDLALAGGLGALIGLYLYVEMVQAESVYIRDALAGAMIGGSLGVFLNAYGPWRDGSWLKLARSVSWGAPAAALGGAVGLVLGELVIGLVRGGLLGRALSWAVLGLGIGLGQGLADRSRDRLAYGLAGGGIGGFVGGLLFEWLRAAGGREFGATGAVGIIQAVGIVVMGAGLGLCLALVEQALRRSWIQVLSGRQEGRIYLLDHPSSRLGLDERAEIGIFGDATVARTHARIDATGSGFALHPLTHQHSTRVNGNPTSTVHSLRDGDRIELGRTLLVFRQR
jgi:hypothetical protein